jgi:hypothetical protein
MSHVTCLGLRARRICYDQREDQREEDQRAEDQRAEDHLAEDHLAEDHRAEDHRAEDHRAEDHRAEDQPAEAGSQLLPVQVTPSHLPSDQADKVEVACHQAAGFQVLPCRSISPDKMLPSASTSQDPPRAASIDPCPVELGNPWTAAARRVAAALLVPLRALAACSALGRSSVPAPSAVALAWVTGSADDVRADLTWSGVRFG